MTLLVFAVTVGNSAFGDPDYQGDDRIRAFPTVWVAASLVFTGSIGAITLTVREYIAHRRFPVGVWSSILAASALWLVLWYLINQ